jgi:hypothetical protein
MLDEILEFYDDLSLKNIRLLDDNITHGGVGRRLLLIVTRGYLFHEAPNFTTLELPETSILEGSLAEREKACERAERALRAYVSVNLPRVKEVVLRYSSKDKAALFKQFLQKERPFETKGDPQVFYPDPKKEFPELVENGNGILVRALLEKIEKCDPKKEKKMAAYADFIINLSLALNSYQLSFFSGEKVGKLEAITFDSILAEAFAHGPLCRYSGVIRKADAKALFGSLVNFHSSSWRLLMFFLTYLKAMEEKKQKVLPNETTFIHVTAADVKTWFCKKKTLEHSLEDPFREAYHYLLANHYPAFLQKGGPLRLPMFLLNPLVAEKIQIRVNSRDPIPDDCYGIVDQGFQMSLDPPLLINEKKEER